MTPISESYEELFERHEEWTAFASVDALGFPSNVWVVQMFVLIRFESLE